MADPQDGDRYTGPEIDIENPSTGQSYVVRSDAFYLNRDTMYSGFEPVRYHGGDLMTMKDLEPPESVAEMSETAGVSKRKAAALAGAGFESPKDLENATPEELKAVPGIGPKDAERLAGAEKSERAGK
jgi:hypothetical protein